MSSSRPTVDGSSSPNQLYEARVTLWISLLTSHCSSHSPKDSGIGMSDDQPVQHSPETPAKRSRFGTKRFVRSMRRRSHDVLAGANHRISDATADEQPEKDQASENATPKRPCVDASALHRMWSSVGRKTPRRPSSQPSELTEFVESFKAFTAPIAIGPPKINWDVPSDTSGFADSLQAATDPTVRGMPPGTVPEDPSPLALRAETEASPAKSTGDSTPTQQNQNRTKLSSSPPNSVKKEHCTSPPAQPIQFDDPFVSPFRKVIPRSDLSSFVGLHQTSEDGTKCQNPPKGLVSSTASSEMVLRPNATAPGYVPGDSPAEDPSGVIRDGAAIIHTRPSESVHLTKSTQSQDLAVASNTHPEAYGGEDAYQSDETRDEAGSICRKDLNITQQSSLTQGDPGRFRVSSRRDRRGRFQLHSHESTLRRLQNAQQIEAQEAAKIALIAAKATKAALHIHHTNVQSLSESAKKEINTTHIADVQGVLHDTAVPHDLKDAVALVLEGRHFNIGKTVAQADPLKQHEEMREILEEAAWREIHRRIKPDNPWYGDLKDYVRELSFSAFSRPYDKLFAYIPRWDMTDPVKSNVAAVESTTHDLKHVAREKMDGDDLTAPNARERAEKVETTLKMFEEATRKREEGVAQATEKEAARREKEEAPRTDPIRPSSRSSFIERQLLGHSLSRALQEADLIPLSSRIDHNSRTTSELGHRLGGLEDRVEKVVDRLLHMDKKLDDLAALMRDMLNKTCG